ncbi:hypothetical protein ElyMa_005236300 [Elysia marginata]|uniref:Uncharacterized protein n=1 Tax=Elysia marginata TaxID=1093978 RepID=A0AAV4JYJ3_9GAST|nr:hypothetical protein ElyMa_005236300 [Elysia marginata]
MFTYILTPCRHLYGHLLDVVASLVPTSPALHSPVRHVAGDAQFLYDQHPTGASSSGSNGDRWSDQSQHCKKMALLRGQSPIALAEASRPSDHQGFSGWLNVPLADHSMWLDITPISLYVSSVALTDRESSR